jgi:hypothetical protein
MLAIEFWSKVDRGLEIEPCMLEGGGKGVILTSRRTRKRVTLNPTLHRP